MYLISYRWSHFSNTVIELTGRNLGACIPEITTHQIYWRVQSLNSFRMALQGTQHARIGAVWQLCAHFSWMTMWKFTVWSCCASLERLLWTERYSPSKFSGSRDFANFRNIMWFCWTWQNPKSLLPQFLFGSLHCTLIVKSPKISNMFVHNHNVNNEMNIILSSSSYFTHGHSTTLLVLWVLPGVTQSRWQ